MSLFTQLRLTLKTGYKNSVLTFLLQAFFPVDRIIINIYLLMTISHIGFLATTSKKMWIQLVE